MSSKEKIIRQREGKALNVIGDHITIKLTGKDTNGLFTLVEQNNPPGTVVPPHIHTREDEVFQVIEGMVEFHFEEQIHVLQSGDSIFLPRNHMHFFKVLGEQPAKVSLSIFPAGIEDMFEELATLPEGPPDIEKVKGICSRYGVSIL
ncbi:cupin domain-containing protein [Algivirga pacifica]|uniref:Cupin type-2 domain-containing protein n=1 Tax=Algivirga pacifica TaxID=1162670 RepID=A0ABP9D8M0_9BACT